MVLAELSSQLKGLYQWTLANKNKAVIFYTNHVMLVTQFFPRLRPVTALTIYNSVSRACRRMHAFESDSFSLR